MRWDGPATTVRSTPERWWRAASTTATVAYDPAGTDRPPVPSKCTSLFWPVRPVSTAAFRLEGPSTSTSSSRPMRARWRSSADRSTTVRSRSNRSATTSAGTNRSVMAAARVPGRGEKMNV